LEIRKIEIILKCVENYPGIRYRELLRATGISNGALAYQTKYLENLKVLIVERKQGATRYYPAGLRKADRRITGYLRNKSTKRIILYVMEHQPCFFADIVLGTGRARSTISVQLTKLRREGIIAVRHGKLDRYEVANKNRVASLVSSYYGNEI